MSWSWYKPKTWPIFQEEYPDLYERKPFQRPLSEIPPGAVVLFSSNRKTDIVGWLIRKITKARVCHAGIYFGSSQRETVEAGGKGIHKDSLDRRINEHDMLWVYTYDTLTVTELQVLKAYAYGTVGRPYDFKNVAGFVLGGGSESESENFCSENVVRSFDQAGIPVSFKKADETSPGDLQLFMSYPDSGWTLWGTQNVKQ